MINLFSKLSLHGLRGSKLVLAGATIATTAVIGSAGVAAAHSWHDWGHHHSNGDPQIVRFCKHHYQDLGFKNVGQCVSAFNRHHGHGYGYGSKHHHHHHHHHHHGDNDNHDNED